jgi:hypothetical protein
LWKMRLTTSVDNNEDCRNKLEGRDISLGFKGPLISHPEGVPVAQCSTRPLALSLSIIVANDWVAASNPLCGLLLNVASVSTLTTCLLSTLNHVLATK